MGRINYITDQGLWENEFTFFVPIKVRFSETDMFGHVNNAIPFVYFEEGRIEFLNSLGFMQEWSKATSETMVVTADMQCDYLKQVYFGQRINVYVKVANIGNSSIDLHYMAKDEYDKACFVGRGRLVQVSKKTGKAIHWSETQLRRLKNEQID